MSIESLSNFTVVPDINQNTITMSWSNPAITSHSIGDVTISDTSNVYTSLVPLSANSGWTFSNNIKVVQIDAGSQHTVILLSNGKVMSFGSNTFGQLGLSIYTTSTAGGISNPTEIPDISNIVHVSCGRVHTALLTKDGYVYLFGSNIYGQLGYALNSGTNNPNFTPTLLADISNVTMVECGGNHTIIVLKNGTALSIGNNQRGQLGNGLSNGSFINFIPTPVVNISNIVSVACGNEFTAFLLNNGTVATCGINLRGQLARNDNANTSNINSTPTVISYFNNVSAIACGFEHLVFLLSNGLVYSCGYNLYGNLGNPTNSGRVTINQIPLQVLNITNATAITCGIYHTVVLTNDSNVYTFGLNQYGQLGYATNYGNSSANFNPTSIKNINDIISISANGNHTILLQRDGQIKLFGLGQNGQLGNLQSDTQLTFENVSVPNTIYVRSGALANHSFFILSNTTYKACGYNNYGQLGTGNSSIIFNSTLLNSSYNGILDIACGTQHTLTLQNTGEVCSFGYNYTGQLGISSTSGLAFPNLTPTKLPNIRNAIQVSAGNSHSAILTSSGQVLTFGSNQRGQLGRTANSGSAIANPIPQAVAGISNAISVSCGLTHTAILLNTGQVVTFGVNLRGQLGIPTNINTNNSNPNPIIVPGINNAISVKCGAEFTIILLANGTLVGFGINQRGQLGISTNYGNQNPVFVPTSISDISNAIAIDCGNEFTVVLLADKTVLTFGMNQYGQLGNLINIGNTNGIYVPTLIPNMNNIKTITAGNSHLFLQKQTGEIYTIGYNIYGQLGDNYYSSTINQIPASLDYSILSPIATSMYNISILIRKGILKSILTKYVLRFMNLGTITNLIYTISVNQTDPTNRSQINLNWDALNFNMYYNIYRISNNSTSLFATNILNNSYIFNSPIDTYYTFYITAYYPTNEESYPSNTVSLKTQSGPKQIDNFAMHKISDRYLLSWDPIITYEDKGNFDTIIYIIQAKKQYETNYSNFIQLDQSITSYYLPNLENNVEYTFRICAQNRILN